MFRPPPRAFTLLALLLALFVPLVGCSAKEIHVDAIDVLVEKVSARHDAYVQADQTLAPAVRDDFLRSTAILRAITAELTEE